MRIICISGVADPEEIQELHQAGIDEFIRKPFEIRAVINRMAEMLNMT
jgi:response regulator RpfG family c-di-GMP phosphodiesterase